MKPLLLPFVFSLLLANTLILEGYSQARPNIVMFLVDDMGWRDCSVGFYQKDKRANTYFFTPNMEKLAANGMMFTHAYANQNCTPSRVSFITGMNTVNSVMDKSALFNFNSKLLPPVSNMNGLATKKGLAHTIYATTLLEILKKAGYASVLVGKAHFGPAQSYASDPINLGFDVNIGGSAAGHPHSYYGTDNYGGINKKSKKAEIPGLSGYWGKNIFLTEALTLEAIKIIDSVHQAGKPFFLYMSHYAVHRPISADSRFVQKYLDMGLGQKEAAYASMIQGMDKSLGDIVDFLDRTGLSKNTIIIFVSDNGGISVNKQERTLQNHNSPLRSEKTSAYEGGLRVPMIVKWPQVIKAGSLCKANVIIEDLFTTIVHAAHAESIPIVQKVDGVNLFPLFKGKSSRQNRLLTWHHPHTRANRSKDAYPFSAIRQGDWKLIYNHLTLGFELYNIKKDLSEKNNLVANKRKKAVFLADKLGNAMKNGNAHMPISKVTGKELPYPDIQIVEFLTNIN